MTRLQTPCATCGHAKGEHSAPERAARPIREWIPYPWTSALGTPTGIALLAWRRAVPLGSTSRVRGAL